MSEDKQPGLFAPVDKQERNLSGEAIPAWRQSILQGMLYASVLFGAAALVIGLLQLQYAWLLPVYVACYAIVVVAAFWRRAPYTWRAITVLVLVYVLGVMGLYEDGLSGDGRLFLLLLPFLAIIFYGRRAGAYALGLAVLTLAAFSWAFSARYLAIPEEMRIYSANLVAWLSGTVVFLLLGVLVVVSLGYLVPHLTTALTQSRRVVQELEHAQEDLHERAQGLEQTRRLLEERAKALEAMAEVTRIVSSILDLDELLTRTVDLLAERFDFYRTGIFLLDPSGEWAVLRAAATEGEQQILSQDLRLQVGGQSVVGTVVASGQPYVASAVVEDSILLGGQESADVRSEMVLPLRARDEIVGAMSVQSREAGAFDDQELAMIQTLAGQVAMAISNARLFWQAQASLEAERRAHGELSQEAWEELLRTRPVSRRRYDPQGILPPEDRWREEVKQALQAGEPIPGAHGTMPTLSIPLKVRGQVIGVLDAHKPAGTDEWATEEVRLMQTLVEQLGVALDSARLYQDTQRRAAQEQLLGEVTGRMRESLDVDTVLQTAVREIYRALELHNVTIRLAEVGEPAEGARAAGGDGSKSGA